MNTSIRDINDAEMRHLLNQLILKDSGSEKLTKNLIEMEAKILFSCTPLLIPGVATGSQILAKLNSKLLYKAFAKWLMISTATVGIGGTAAYIATQDTPPVKKQNPAPISQELTSSDIVVKPENSFEIEPATQVNPQRSILDSERIAPLPPKKSTELAQIRLLPSEIIFLPDGRNGKNKKPVLPNADTEMQFEKIEVIHLTAEMTNIQIVGTAGNEKAQVQLIGKTKSEKDSDRNFEINAHSENGELFIDVHDKSKRKVFGGRKQVDPVDLILKVTGNVNLEIHNSSGEVNVSGIKGKFCKVHNDYGKVNLQHINAETAIQLESGNVDAIDIKGKTSIQCNYGNIKLNDYAGDLEVSVNSGNFNGASMEGDVRVEVNYGNVGMENCKGSSLKVTTNSGNFNLNESRFTVANITVDYGNLKLLGTESNLNLHSNSGNVIIDDHKGSATINADYGNQEIKNQRGNLSLHSNSGKILLENINGNLQIAADYSNVNLKGLLGDLNARLESGNFIGTGVKLQDQAQLSTSFGNISLQTENRLDDLTCDLGAESGNVRLRKEGTELSKSNGKIQLDKGKIKILARADSGNILVE